MFFARNKQTRKIKIIIIKNGTPKKIFGTNGKLFVIGVAGRVAKLVGHLTHKSRGPGFDARSGHILSFLLPLIQEGQLSVTGESMCTK